MRQWEADIEMTSQLADERSTERLIGRMFGDAPEVWEDEAPSSPRPRTPRKSDSDPAFQGGMVMAGPTAHLLFDDYFAIEQGLQAQHLRDIRNPEMLEEILAERPSPSDSAVDYLIHAQEYERSRHTPREPFLQAWLDQNEAIFHGALQRAYPGASAAELERCGAEVLEDLRERYPEFQPQRDRGGR